MTEVCRAACGTATGEIIPAELMVWAAGIKAPDFLQRSRWTGDQPQQPARGAADAADHARCDVFAIGDCAACPWPGRRAGCRRVRKRRISRRRISPGRCGRLFAGKPLQPYRYRDFGSLVSLGEYSHGRQSDGRR